MSLQAIDTPKLYQRVADQIVNLILKGHWREGERLPAEREMAKQLGVSRPTVREAVIALELLGLVEVKTGAGIYVKSIQNMGGPNVLQGEDAGPSPFELIEARIVFESEIAALAAARITEAELAGLMDAIEKMEADIDKGVQMVSNRDDGDMLFHSRIAAVTGNAVMRSIIEQLWEGMRGPMFKAISNRVRLPEHARAAAKAHRRIHAALASGSPERAKAAMREHLEEVRAVLMRNGDA
jgi:DNA-binding FadR family transcriptional regulator